MLLCKTFRQRVGGDAHIAPANRTVFTESFGKSVIAQWVDVGIDPYEPYGSVPKNCRGGRSMRNVSLTLFHIQHIHERKS